MEQSQQVLEWQADAEKRGQAKGETIGMTKGQAEGLLKLLRKRFPGELPTKLSQLMRKTEEISLIDHWMDLALTAKSLEEFQRLMEKTAGSP